VTRYRGGGGWRPRGSGRGGRPWCGGGSPELDEDDRRGYRDEAGSHEERQPVAGDQGAVGGAGTAVGDGGKHGEPGGGANLLGGDEQAARDALLAGRYAPVTAMETVENASPSPGLDWLGPGGRR
jgi:hypothetical protein